MCCLDENHFFKSLLTINILRKRVYFVLLLFQFMVRGSYRRTTIPTMRSFREQQGSIIETETWLFSHIHDPCYSVTHILDLQESWQHGGSRLTSLQWFAASKGLETDIFQTVTKLKMTSLCLFETRQSHNQETLTSYRWDKSYFVSLGMFVIYLGK